MGSRQRAHELNQKLLITFQARTGREFSSGERKHLERSMAEFDYRFNNRKDVGIFIKPIARMCT
jgi:hypothetical protein